MDTVVCWVRPSVPAQVHLLPPSLAGLLRMGNQPSFCRAAQKRD